ncbi:helix-turn-helix domain-containing protein [Halorhodospira halochloris]|uniref:helix-turn-helix domain-containing protein n=1 Tax=Halorhodospira halochloris TaxID=1052 RepID=UPI000BBB66BD|nr:hypothetical protein [Halorhodospira halochloris]
MVQRKVTYRLYPTQAQLAELEHQRWAHCLLWNEALAEHRSARKRRRRPRARRVRHHWCALDGADRAVTGAA